MHALTFPQGPYRGLWPSGVLLRISTLEDEGATLLRNVGMLNYELCKTSQKTRILNTKHDGLYGGITY